jgi:hypothetical protein
VLGEVKAVAREVSLDGCWHRLASLRVFSPELSEHTLVNLSDDENARIRRLRVGFASSDTR